MIEIKSRGDWEAAAKFRKLFLGWHFWGDRSRPRARVVHLLLKNGFADDASGAKELLAKLVGRRIEYDQAMFFELTEVFGSIRLESGDYCRDVC